MTYFLWSMTQVIRGFVRLLIYPVMLLLFVPWFLYDALSVFDRRLDDWWLE